MATAACWPGHMAHGVAVLRLAAAFLTLLLAALSGAARASPWDLSSYGLCSFIKLYEIQDNASGAAYMPETGTIWVVVNNPSGLYEYDLGGKMLRHIDTAWLRDPEDVMYIGKDRIAVVEEENGGGIHELDVSRAAGGKLLRSIPIDVWRWPGAGMEGAAYNLKSGEYYITQEKGPKRVLVGKPPGNAWKEIISGDTAYSSVKDLAAVYYAEALAELFVLSQESNRVLRSTMTGTVLQDIWVKGTRPEGLTFTPDGMTMIVVSEPNELALYRAGGCAGTAKASSASTSSSKGNGSSGGGGGSSSGRRAAVSWAVTRK